MAKNAKTRKPVHKKNVVSHPLRCKLLFSDAILPTKGTKYSAGYDLYSHIDTVIPPGGTTLVRTGIAIQIPEGCYGKIEGRSSLAKKHSVFPLAGVIDEDYRGDITVVLHNLGKTDFTVNKSDRIAQLVVMKYHNDLSVIEVKVNMCS